MLSGRTCDSDFLFVVGDDRVMWCIIFFSERFLLLIPGHKSSVLKKIQERMTYWLLQFLASAVVEYTL